MQNSNNLFSKLPLDLFKALSGPNKQLYWKILVRLYEHYFDDDVSFHEEYGHTRTAITSSITAALEGNSGMWVDELEDNVLKNVKERSLYIKNHNHVLRAWVGS